jgi:inorganic pyrophosphatase
MKESGFWLKLDTLVSTSEMIVDRPIGSPHPRYASLSYPLDYGYLRGTRAGDGEGIDVWIGSAPEWGVTGIICTVELERRDAEVKILLGCTPDEARIALSVHNVGSQSAVLLERTVCGSA